MQSATPVAWLILLMCLPVVLGLIKVRGPRLGVFLALVGGVLLLPVRLGVDLPVIPALDRSTLPPLSALAGVLLFHPASLRRTGPAPFVLLAVLVFSAFATTYANGDPVFIGDRTAQALSYYDAASKAQRDAVTIFIPFLLGVALIRSPADLRPLLMVIAGAALLYSIPILYEIRMSPRIHKILFGYHPHLFGQTFRGGGWRPVVLTSHGLELSLFMSIATLAAAGIARRNLQLLRVPGKAAAVFLAAIVLFCKSAAATLYMVVLLPLIAFARPLVQVRVAAAILAIVVIYPTLRIIDVFPTAALTDAARLMSHERAHSLEFRFRNEDLLMERIRERPIAGWGGYSRPFRYHADSKKLLTVPDGYWLIRMAGGGVLSILPVFAVFSIPVFLALVRVRKIRSARNRSWLATFALMVAVIALDVLPNAMINALTFFLPGALLGALRNLNPASAQRRRPPGPGQPGKKEEARTSVPDTLASLAESTHR